jgi:hypothetical protein
MIARLGSHPVLTTSTTSSTPAAAPQLSTDMDSSHLLDMEGNIAASSPPRRRRPMQAVGAMEGEVDIERVWF